MLLANTLTVIAWTVRPMSGLHPALGFSKDDIPGEALTCIRES